MPYGEALQVVLAAADLEFRGPVIGLDTLAWQRIESDLVDLGLCHADDRGRVIVDVLGKIALRGSMDVRSNVLVCVGALFGIEGHAQVAAAFLAVKLDIFQDVLPTVRPQAGLLPCQVALACAGGDLSLIHI